MIDKPHRLITPLKGKLVSDLSAPGSYLSGYGDAVAERLRGPKSLLGDASERFCDQVAAVAKIEEAGGVAGAMQKKASHEKKIAALERDRAKIAKEYALLESLEKLLEDRPGKIIADTGRFRSQVIAKTIKSGKMVWIDNVQRQELSDKITLAQKFKISTDVPDADSLFDFGADLQKESLLRMPFDSMFIEYVEQFKGCAIAFSLFVEDWVVHLFLNHGNKWFCFHVEDEFETVVEAGAYYNLMVFLVLLASRSTTVLPSNEHGKPMAAAEGEKPKFSHHLVKLRAVEQSRSMAGGHHAPPRLHWRRGHIRRQHHGRGGRLVKKVWIAPTLVGSVDRGVVTHDYEVTR